MLKRSTVKFTSRHEALSHIQQTFAEEVSLSIVWTGSEHEDDINEVARYFLALAQENEESVFEQSLTFWYKEKNVEKFKKKFPLKTDPNCLEIKNLHQKHHIWNLENQIQYTPTVFMNGRVFPSQYNPSDLKYLIRGLLARA